MGSQLNPYLSFADNAKQAMEHYQSIFGGEVEAMTFADMPGIPGADDPAEASKVMHSQLRTPSGFALMAADTPSHVGTPSPNGTVSLSGDDEAELRRYWDGLSTDGTVTVPLEKAPWGDTFGMCTDRFGVAWLVNIAGQPQ